MRKTRNNAAVFCFLVLFYLSGFTIATLVNYEKGYEYLYRMNSTIELKDVQRFIATAEIGFVNIAKNDSYQELLLVVHQTRFSPHDRPDINGQIYNMSKWFSFEITQRGEIGNVYYAPHEEVEVVTLKKGFAGLLSAKLHHLDEISRDRDQTEWEFDTNEIGKEGPHSATYNVKRTAKGYEFRKRRTSALPQAINGTSDYEKTIHIHNELNTIHNVTITEKYTMDFSEKPGSDISFYSPRPVHDVSDSDDDMELPEIQATSNDELRFYEKRPVVQKWDKPLQLVIASIQHDFPMNSQSAITFKRKEDIQAALSFISGNMTCIRNAPPDGSMGLTVCFQQLVLNMKKLPDEVLGNITNMYLISQDKTIRNSDRLNFVDALGAVQSTKAQSLLLEKVIKNPAVDSQLYLRALFAIVSMDSEPSHELVNAIASLCLTGRYEQLIVLPEHSRHRTCLTYGSLIRRLKTHGKEKEALEHVKRLHSELGIHDPWLFKTKRSAMSEREMLEQDLNKVVLLDSIGNAGMDSSYEYIVSHINSSNAQWIKRSGIHALRSFHDEKVLNELEKVALHDEEETVRYEAMLQYQAHPLAKRQSNENGLEIVNDGIHKRSIFDKSLKFKLEAPGVDWMKFVGSQTIGASFGVLMENLLDVQLSLLKGSVDIRVHDEVFSRVHFGIIGVNLDFYSARLCFKGSAKYSLNIVQEGDLQRMIRIVREFSTIARKIVRNVKDGVEAFKAIVDDDFSLKDTVDNFVKSVEELPERVLSLGSKIRKILDRISNIAQENLPPFMQKVKKFMDAVTELYEKVREDVMTFYNTIVEGVKIVIPHAAEQIYESVQGIIRAFMKIFKDPKTALADIGKGVIVIYVSVKQVEILKEDIMSHTFVADGLEPYWSNLKGETDNIQQLFEEAVHAVQTESRDWVKELIENDPVAKLTAGKMTMESVREEIRSEIEAEINDLLEPIFLLQNIGGQYVQTFFTFIDVFKDIKEAYILLKNGYKTSKSLLNSMFGHKFDKDFPKTRRTSGDGCSGTGFYPSSLEDSNIEYKTKGIDLMATDGEELVAPVAGTILLSDNNNEIIIENSDDLPQGSTLILTNVEPLGHIEHLSQVASGEIIGTVTKSPCGENNHIHVSIKRGGGVVDPTSYLDDREFNAPNWLQICDDYKVVYKFETVASGYVVGLDGRKEEDTTENIEEDDSLATDEMDESERPGQDVQEIKDNDVGLFKSLAGKLRGKRSVALTSFNTTLDALVTNIKEFLRRFSIRRIKLGAIVQLLEQLGLYDTREKMATLIKDIHEAVTNEQCKSPHHMTKQELENELHKRGKQTKGSNEEMIKELTRADISCPMLKLALPENDLLYCTFDEKCVAIECCLTIELFELLQKSITIYARLHGEPLTLTFGVNTWTYSENTTIFEEEEHGFKDTGIDFDFLDGQRIILKYSYIGTTTKLTLSFGIGICDVKNIVDCFVYIPLLEEAVFQFPSINPDGTLHVEEFKVEEYYDEIKENLEDAPIDVAHATVNYAINKFLEEHGIDESDLLNNPECPRPQNKELEDLKTSLEEKGLSTTGTREELDERYLLHDLSCTSHGIKVELPRPTNDLLYYYISDDCMKVSVCLDIQIPQLELSRSFTAYLELDPCHYTLTKAFEKKEKTIFTFEYEWGKDEVVKLTDDINILLRINRDVDEKVFQIDFDLRFEEFSETVLEGHQIPIPICDENFSLEESMQDIATALGGELSEAVFNLVLKKLNLYDIIRHGKCSLPEAPEGCPESMNVVIPDSMKDILTCVLPTNCFGIVCCAQFPLQIPFSTKTIDVKFPVWFKLDPCGFTANYGIAERVEDETFLKYEWGKDKIVPIGSNKEDAPIILKYAVDKDDKGYIVDMRVDVCIPVDDDKLCVPRDGLVLLDKQAIPLCDARRWEEFEDFSLNEWLEAKGEDIHAQLSNAGREALLDFLGIKGWIAKPPCDRKRPNYSPSISGWNNLCPLSFVRLPNIIIEDKLSCSVPEYCTGIDCCLDIEKLGLSVRAYLDINMCTYVISGGIETKTFSKSLFNYEWGKTETVTIQDFLRLTYTIKKLDDKKVLIVTLEVAVCFEKDGPCLFQKKVLDGTEIPQIGCDWTIDYSKFSMSTWLENNGLTSIDPLDIQWDDAVTFVLAVIGVDEYLLDEPCTTTDAIYSGAVDNWKSECDFLQTNLPTLPASTVCHIASSCTALGCCAYVDYLKITLHASLEIDFCDFVIKGNLEKLSFEVNLIEYDWGNEVDETIAGLIRVRFKIDKAEKHFIVDLSLSVCMEAEQECQFHHDFYKNTLMPIPICNPDMPFSIQDFSLKNWLNDVGHSLEETLPTAVVALLLSQLKLDKFLQNPSCAFTDTLYTNPTNGWSSECSSSLLLPTLPENIVCHIPDYCSGFDCCLDIDILRRTIHVKFLLDVCNYKLTIGIERLEREIILLDHNWGETKHLYLGGAIRIDYTIDDLKSEAKFIVNVKLSICFEQTACFFTTDVLKDAYINNPLCTWNGGLLIEGYNLTNWMSDFDFEFDEGKLKDYMVDVLFRELGIAPYLLDNECNRDLAPYTDSSNGVNSDCASQLELGVIPDLMTCYVSESCSSFNCCINVEFAQRSLSLYTHIDECTHTLTIGIEKYHIKVSLLNYVWGTEEEFSLFGVIQIRGSIVNLEAEKQYIVNLKVSICLKSATCEEHIDLLTDARIPKTGCNGNVEIHDFSLDKYLESNEQNIGDIDEPLPKTLADKLLEKLDVLSFLDESVCPPVSHNAVSECEGFHFPTSLPDMIACKVPSYCTAIDCCITIPLISRSVNVSVDLNACYRNMVITVGKLKSEITLLNYNYGEWNTLSVVDVFRIEYNIEELTSSKEFVLSVKMSVCLDSATCVMEALVLDEAVLPQQTCEFNDGFQILDFSLSKWIEENSEDSDKYLPKLQEDLDVTSLLRSQQCEVTSSGWTSDCPDVASLPVLPSHINCHMNDQCTGFECCLQVTELNRAIAFYFEIDTCNDRISAGIENLHNNFSLIGYEFDKTRQIDLHGILDMKYIINDNADGSAFVVTSEINICFEKNIDCDTIPLLQTVNFPKPLCDLDMDFQTPDFRLDDWMMNEGLESTADISDVMLAKLINTLGIAPYKQADQCSHSAAPFSRSVNGWSNDCPLDVPVESIPTELKCYIPNFCTGFECCVTVETLRHNFRITLEIDSCNNRFVAGIENLNLNISLSDYEWGKLHTMTLKGIFRIRYLIYNYEETRQYGIDFSISVCLSVDHCEFEIHLLDNVTFTKPLCALDTGFLIPDFSFETWLQSQNVENLLDIPEEVIGKLMKETGLQGFLKSDACNRSLTPYFPSENGWRSDCPSDVEMPVLSGPITCAIPDVCTGFKCCIDVDVLSRSFEVKVQIDICKYKIDIELEKMHVSVPLIGYEYGKENKVYLFGILRVRFTINEMDGSGFQITAAVDVCLENSQSCMFSATVLDNSYLPSKTCDHGTGFKLQDFSFEKWLTDNDVDSTSPLTGTSLVQLMSTYGLDEHLLTEQCDRNDVLYQPSENGIKLGGCSGLLSSFSSSIPDWANCAVLDNCLGFQCCVDAPNLDRSFEFFFDIDVCKYMITFRLESYISSFLLSTDELEDWKTVEIQGVLKIEYRIFDILGEDEIVLDIRVGICLSDMAKCQVEFSVMEKQRVVRPSCTEKLGFVNPDFSFASWLNENGIDAGITSLLEVNSESLMSDLAITKYLQNDECEVQSTFMINDCTGELEENILPEGASCKMNEECTSVSCCVQSQMLLRNFVTGITIDPCERIIYIMLEKYTRKYSFSSFKFGEINHLDLFGTIRISYIVTDLPLSKMYALTMNYAFCIDESTCLTNITLLNNYLFEKQDCKHQYSGFDLERFGESIGTSVHETLDLEVIPIFLQMSGLANFLSEDECDRSLNPFQGRQWTSVSTCAIPEPEAQIPDSISCFISDDCSELKFCLDAYFIKRTLLIDLTIDPCLMNMHIAIENFRHTLELNEENFGVLKTVTLANIMTLRMKVEHISRQSASILVLNLNVLVCFDETACDIDATIFEDTEYLLPACDYNKQFSEHDFSLSEWREEHNQDSVESLPTFYSKLLLEHLDMAEYLSSECAADILEEEKFADDCLDAKPDWFDRGDGPLYCIFKDSCTNVQGCFNSADLGRSFTISFDIKSCDYELVVAIENLSWKTSLAEYEWGKQETISLFGIISLK